MSKLPSISGLLTRLRMGKYYNDPVGFAENVLKVTLWSKQKQILEAVVKYKKVFVQSCNGAGKTFILACLLLWHYCTRLNSISLFTAPTARQTNIVLMREIRQLINNAGLNLHGLLPKEARIQDSDSHVLFGFTADNASAFQGIHSTNVFVGFDEATGIHPDIWNGARGITLGGDCYFVVILNPTDIASQAYIESQSDEWHIINISFDEHPNILLEQSNLPPILPGAIRLEAVRQDIKLWCDEITQEITKDVTCFEFEGKCWKPSAEAEARLLGRWPNQSSYSIFSQNDFVNKYKPDNGLIFIGCDVACQGSDLTEIHVRQGNTSIHHESFGGKDTKFTAERLKENCRRFAKAGQYYYDIPVAIDVIGFGRGVYDQRNEYNFVPVNAAESSLNVNYNNKRTELLFKLRHKLRNGEACLANIPQNQLKEIIRQAMAVTYKLDGKGRTVAEKKENSKEMIGRSPDGLDAVALCYYLDSGKKLGMVTVPFKDRSNRKDDTLNKRDDEALLRHINETRQNEMKRFS